MLSVSLSGQQIVHAEYFTGGDPGYGNATPVAVTAASEVEMSLNIPLGELDHGLQTLYARVKDSNGTWSHTFHQVFLVYRVPQDPKPLITTMEYFFDGDPGFGLAVPIDFQPGTDIEVAVELPLDDLSDGAHILYVRGRDEKGRWGMIFSQAFMKFFTPADEALLTRMEYFVNTDPGFGKGIVIELNTPRQSVMKYFVVDPGHLQPGTNTLYVRALDTRGRWGLVHAASFEVFETGPCDPPAELFATDVTEHTASLGWTQEGTGSVWDLLWVPDGQDYTEDGTLAAGVTVNPHQADELYKAILYGFYARVVCSDGQVSQWAGPGLFHTHPLPVNELILDADPPEGGTLSGQGSYPWGETVTIEATPNTNFVFEYWSGDSHYLDDPGVASGTVTVALEPIALTAHFRDVTGIAGTSERSLRIFPNPARDKLFVAFDNPDGGRVDVQLVNVQGRITGQKVIRGKDRVETILSTSVLPPGIYMLVIRGEQWTVVRKVVVK